MDPRPGGVTLIEIGPARRWLESHWEDGGIVFYFEVGVADGQDGWVLRQVELHGPDRAPRTAAALGEWPTGDGADVNAARRAYIDRYGATADQPVSVWDEDFPHREIGVDEFERVWTAARAELDRQP